MTRLSEFRGAMVGEMRDRLNFEELST